MQTIKTKKTKKKNNEQKQKNKFFFIQQYCIINKIYSLHILQYTPIQYSLYISSSHRLESAMERRVYVQNSLQSVCLRLLQSDGRGARSRRACGAVLPPVQVHPERSAVNNMIGIVRGKNKTLVTYNTLSLGYRLLFQAFIYCMYKLFGPTLNPALYALHNTSYTTQIEKAYGVLTPSPPRCTDNKWMSRMTPSK